jgi:Zn-dependent peptidase ImmA (M78 family)
MTVDYICREVAKLKQKYGENDPFILARAMGIFVMFEPMGHRIEDCNGFFLAQSRKKAITINSDLPEPLQRIICIHEVGHAVLHAKQLGVCAFHDFSLFEGTSRAEYEANMFSADYLLDDGVVLDILNEDCFFFAAASRLRVPAELLDFKFRILKNKGYKLESPFVSDSCFLKNVQVPNDEEHEC